MKQPGSQSFGGGQQFSGGQFSGYQVPFNPYMAQQQVPQGQQQGQPPILYPTPQQLAQTGSPFQTSPAAPGTAPIEQSYIENILRLNRGKLATVYMTFSGSKDGSNTKMFKGIIEAAGRDHLILSDPQTGMRYLLPMIYLDYITFDEEIEYSYPFTNQVATYSPR